MHETWIKQGARTRGVVWNEISSPGLWLIGDILDPLPSAGDTCNLLLWEASKLNGGWSNPPSSLCWERDWYESIWLTLKPLLLTPQHLLPHLAPSGNNHRQFEIHVCFWMDQKETSKRKRMNKEFYFWVGFFLFYLFSFTFYLSFMLIKSKRGALFHPFRCEQELIL